MSTSKFRIKLGAIEVEYEGSDEFLKKELPDLLAAVSSLHKEVGAEVTTSKTFSAPAASNGADSIAGTTATIAAKLNVDSGPDLIVAAAAQLTFVAGKDEFTRRELTAACRAGKNFWKKSYGNNFTKYLSTLVGDNSLIEVRDGTYALGAKKRQALEAQLAAD